jgi:hypothetical protein
MIPELVSCFDRTVAFMQESVADLAEEDIVLQPPGVPNHAAWTLGHVIHSCQAMAGELGVEPWLPRDWGSQFGYGSSPTAVVSQYSSKAALLAAMGEASHRLRTALLGMDDTALAEPLVPSKNLIRVSWQGFGSIAARPPERVDCPLYQRARSRKWVSLER